MSDSTSSGAVSFWIHLAVQWRQPVDSRHFLGEIAKRGGTSAAITAVGQEGVQRWMEDVGIRCYQRTIERVVAWVANAAERLASEKTANLHCEQDLAGLLAATH